MNRCVANFTLAFHLFFLLITRTNDFIMSFVCLKHEREQIMTTNVWLTQVSLY